MMAAINEVVPLCKEEVQYACSAASAACNPAKLTFAQAIDRAMHVSPATEGVCV